MTDQPNPTPIAFKAETRQLLDILIHSLYTEREIFVRELISNASDALTRVDFELLTNREALNPDLDLAIRITANPDDNTLTIEDTGIGMTADEMATNLGTIARSGARDFMAVAKETGASNGSSRNLSDLIGQFGVGFYSAFMAAEWIRVVSRSFRPEAQAAVWYSTGSDTYTIEPAERAARGTTITVKLKADAAEFTQEGRLREIIRKHSDFIPFPIYLGQATEQVNRQTAIWRQSPREVEKSAYDDFYKQLTLEFEAPLTHTHLSVDAPVQMYAILYIPASAERGVLALRREDGLKLYARKVLIQEYNRDLLPEYLGFIQGVVDSEDLPLNVSRESVQSNRVMAQLKKLVASKSLEMLKKLAADDPAAYEKFWHAFGRALKQGVATEPGDFENLLALLRFRTNLSPDKWSSLDEVLGRMKDGQEKLYYLIAEDERSAQYSPHLDLVRSRGYEVILMTDPIDAFMLPRLETYKEKALVNLATADLPPDPQAAIDSSAPVVPSGEQAGLIERFKACLGERVVDVRVTERLSDSPARLTDPDGAANPELQRVYRLIHKDYQTPRKVLEINPRHPIIVRLSALPDGNELGEAVIEQVFEDALLIEGLHPDPAGMIARIQKLMEAALNQK
jgi:molecular chaperone HtpG